MGLSSTYQSTSPLLLSTLYEPPPKHLINVREDILEAPRGYRLPMRAHHSDSTARRASYCALRAHSFDAW